MRSYRHPKLTLEKRREIVNKVLSGDKELISQIDTLLYLIIPTENESKELIYICYTCKKKISPIDQKFFSINGTVCGSCSAIPKNNF